MRFVLVSIALRVAPMVSQAEPVRLHAAGSLKAAMADTFSEFEATSAVTHKVGTVLGASGLLRERIEKGEQTHVFASADTGYL